ncbi:FtsL-like putative cell division protein [Taibaiella soli]|uniref:S-adenosyl-methyltransferase n=1 Tax=Taibaiella soli TaxID=1649169 RepID=A0A2W2BWV1_9BACT|nr:FtsL-like putative cell division protein [Taibaiella soli]PZF72333.1 hypothetical protein DN068_13330 [Taibaiella soli]
MEEKVQTNSGEPTPAQRIRNDWKALLERISYKGIVHNVPFLGFVALLGIIYISNSQRAIATQRELNKEEKVLKELRWKYMDIKSKLMNAGMEAEVIRNGSGIGLKPLMLPAYKIETDSVKK